LAILIERASARGSPIELIDEAEKCQAFIETHKAPIEKQKIEILFSLKNSPTEEIKFA
jgi:hypothetical protein